MVTTGQHNHFENDEEDTVNEIIGMYGHDCYTVDIISEVLGISETKIEQLIKKHGIGMGDY